jgi:hypothetical protein
MLTKNWEVDLTAQVDSVFVSYQEFVSELQGYAVEM